MSEEDRAGSYMFRFRGPRPFEWRFEVPRNAWGDHRFDILWANTRKVCGFRWDPVVGYWKYTVTDNGVEHYCVTREWLIAVAGPLVTEELERLLQVAREPPIDANAAPIVGTPTPATAPAATASSSSSLSSMQETTSAATASNVPASQAEDASEAKDVAGSCCCASGSSGTPRVPRSLTVLPHLDHDEYSDCCCDEEDRDARLSCDFCGVKGPDCRIIRYQCPWAKDPSTYYNCCDDNHLTCDQAHQLRQQKSKIDWLQSEHRDLKTRLDDATDEIHDLEDAKDNAEDRVRLLEAERAATLKTLLPPIARLRDALEQGSRCVGDWIERVRVE